MTINPQQKKILSAIAVGAGASVLVAISHDLSAFVATLPAWVQMGAQMGGVALLTGAAHALDAWGHTERVEQAVDKVLGQPASADMGDAMKVMLPPQPPPTPPDAA